MKEKFLSKTKFIISILFFLIVSISPSCAEDGFYDGMRYIIQYETTGDGKGFSLFEYYWNRAQSDGFVLTQVRKLSKSQFGLINAALDKFNTRKGEIYSIAAENVISGKSFIIICEITSDYDYYWWCFSTYN